ncbi:phosphonates transport ATP-binding protein PhnC [Burkholderia pseudomallei]|nr:phosphonates transport ATP-binding protein PhnC [Burkholderia pseudomallei]
MDAIRIERLSKTFPNGRKGLEDIDLAIAPGEMVALIGASGSGKSTLLRQIASFSSSDARPSRIDIFGRSIQRDGRIARDVRRMRRDIGFVFQQFNLVDRLSVETNVLIGALARVPMWRRLAGRFSRAANLSGGQQQRAALARALVQRARIILADEPIASLDPAASRRVMEMLRALNANHRLTVLVSLHQIDVALRFCPRVVALRAGRIVYDGPSAALTRERLHALYGDDAHLPFAVGDEVRPAAREAAGEPARRAPAAFDSAGSPDLPDSQPASPRRMLAASSMR